GGACGARAGANRSDARHARGARHLGHARDHRVPGRALSRRGHLARGRRAAGAGAQPVRGDALELLRAARTHADEHSGLASGQGARCRGRVRHCAHLPPARPGAWRPSSGRPVPVRAVLRGRRVLRAGADAAAHLRCRAPRRPRALGRGHPGAATDARLDRRGPGGRTIPRPRRAVSRSPDRGAMKIYRVGGAVRDALLGLPPGDTDWVVVGATPERMAELGYTPVGRDFPVFLHPRTHEEYALARTERKTARGYRGFAFNCSPEVSLEADLAPRDLTVHAVAQADDGSLVDPCGGQRDIAARVLRHVGAAFAEDPVRILRLARFAARFPDFDVAPETLALARAMVASGEVDALVPERCWQEIARGLMTQHPSRMFAVLRECGALARILPELDRPGGGDGRELDRALRAADHAAGTKGSLELRFAALC